MPIVDEHLSGVRRYAVFTFATDDQGGKPGSPALRFPHSPHSSSLEVSTRLRHRESFFMKRMKSLEKGFMFPFVDVSFFSSYQHLEEMKRLIEPTDCVNFHDPNIRLQKGCYEEVQLVDPKRDMIQTPIDDEEDDEDRGSGGGSMGSADVNRNRSKPKVVHPPGIQTGADDYKKTRGYIVIAYKTMEYMYSREFLSSWKTWTGVRYICMQMPRQLGLRRIAFYRQLSCTSDFSYVLLIEVTNLLLYAAQTLNLMDRIKLRLCGCAGVFRETDFQVDPVTANVHHISTTYRPPEKPPVVSITTALGRLDSGDNIGSHPSRKPSRAHLLANVEESTNTEANVDTLMQLLKQQQEAAARRKASMDAPMKAGKKRHSLAPPDQPAPAPPPETVSKTSGKKISEESTRSGEQQQHQQPPKKAPKAKPESEDSDPENNGGESADDLHQQQQQVHNVSKVHATDKRMFQSSTNHYDIPGQQQIPPQRLLQPPQHQHQPLPMYHSTAPVYPIEMATAMSTSLPPAHPYFAHHYHQADTLPLQQQHQHQQQQQPFYDPILTQPIDILMQNLQHPLEDMIASDYHPVYTYSGNPVQNIPFGFVQAAVPRTPPDSAPFDYNSPVYSRNEWKQSSTVYGNQGEESMRNLAEQFRSLRETPIVGSDPYLLSSVDRGEGGYGSYHHHHRGKQHSHDDDGHDEDPEAFLDGIIRRERSRSTAFLEDPRRVLLQHQQHRNHTLPEKEKLKARKAQSETFEKKMHEAERLQKKIVEAGKFMDAEKLQQKIAEAENLQQKIADAERLQQKIVEAERIQQKLAIAEMIQQQQHSAVAEAERLKQKLSEEKASHHHRERGPYRQRSAPKLDEATSVDRGSPTRTPRRRTLPKIPMEADTIYEKMESDTKPYHTVDKRHASSSKPAQRRVSPKEEPKEAVNAEPYRSRTLEKPRHKEQPAAESRQKSHQAQSGGKQEHLGGAGGGATVPRASRPSPSNRASRPTENGTEGKAREASSSANGRKAVSPTRAANPATLPRTHADAQGQPKTSAAQQSTATGGAGSRSRSRDDLTAKRVSSTKPIASGHEAPTTSSAHHKTSTTKPPIESTAAVASTSGVEHQTRKLTKTEEPPKPSLSPRPDKSPSATRVSPSRHRQSFKKRKQ